MLTTHRFDRKEVVLAVEDGWKLVPVDIAEDGGVPVRKRAYHQHGENRVMLKRGNHSQYSTVIFLRKEHLPLA